MSHTDFFAFARERHNIYLRRQAGQSKPWTKDEILRQFKFTNVFRELDATTIWIRENIRDPLRDSDLVFQAIVIARWFNRISTLEVVKDLILSGEWTAEKARPLLEPLKPIFTNAFMINSPTGIDKLTGVLSYIDGVLPDLPRKVQQMRKTQQTLQDTTDWLTKFQGLAAFMAYEIVTDLRWTSLLENAPDIMTWANPGPGCVEGLKRTIPGENIGGKGYQVALILDLLEKSRDPTNWPAEWPALEMRDVEHTLCEFGKYERTRLGEGTPKILFDGGGEKTIAYGSGSNRGTRTPRAPEDPNEAFIRNKMASDYEALSAAENELAPVLLEAAKVVMSAYDVPSDWFPETDQIVVDELGTFTIPLTRLPAMLGENGIVVDWFDLDGEALDKLKAFTTVQERVAAKEQRLRDMIKELDE